MIMHKKIRSTPHDRQEIWEFYQKEPLMSAV